MLSQVGNEGNDDEIARRERELAAAREEFGEAHRKTLSAINELALAHHSAGRSDEAFPLLRDVAARAERAFGPDHPTTTLYLNNLGVIAKAADDAEAALDAFRRALEGRERILGPEHPETIDSREEIGHLLRGEGKYDEAIAQYARAAADRTNAFGADARSTLTARNCIAVAYNWSDRHEEAADWHRKVLADRTRALGEDHEDTVQSRSNLAFTLLRVDAFEEAIPVCAAVVADRTRLQGADHHRTLLARFDEARAFDGALRSAEALERYRALLPGYERAFGTGDQRTQTLADDIADPPRAWFDRRVLNGEELWLVSLSAPLSERNGDVHTTLYPYAHLDATRGTLKDSWGVTDTESLYGITEWLTTDGGHRDVPAYVEHVGHPPLAWDVCRYAYLVRCAIAMGYIGEDDAWRLLRAVREETLATYDSWRAVAEDYLAGRDVWLSGRPDRQPMVAATERLLDPENARSPWNMIPWV
jgi:tetratricopeptide (TPR) repeat protein